MEEGDEKEKGTTVRREDEEGRKREEDGKKTDVRILIKTDSKKNRKVGT